MFQTDQQYITKELEALRQSEREAWRYADELEQERKQLQEMLNRERTENESLLRRALTYLEYASQQLPMIHASIVDPVIDELKKRLK